jgi:hypothetical protein
MALAATTAGGMLGVACGPLVMLLYAGLAVHLRFAHGRAGGHFMIRLEAVDILPGQMALDHVLDVVELLDLIRASE